MNAHQRRVARRKIDRKLRGRIDTSDLVELLRLATEKVCRLRPPELESIYITMSIGESAWQESQPEVRGSRDLWAQGSTTCDDIGLRPRGHEGTGYPPMNFTSYEEALLALREQPIDLNAGTAWSAEKEAEEAAAFEAWRREGGS